MTRIGMILITLSVSSLSAYAQEASTLRLKSSSMPDTTTPSMQKDVGGGLKYEFTQYTVSKESDPRLNQSQLTESHIDFLAGRYVDLNYSFFAVQDLNTGVNFGNTVDSKVKISVGRKQEFWSEADRNWQLGLWQPKFNIDPLRPVDQGLTGLFLQADNGEWQFLSYASPIFIPTQNPDISEKNGNLVSSSRWTQSPSGSGEVLNKDTRFVYSLSVPEVSKLINNPGAGMRLRYGGVEPGFWSSVNFARKPINSLFIKYDYNLLIQSAGSQADIAVSPVVVYHRLYGADAGWKMGETALSASYLQDEPEADSPQNNINADTGEPTTDWIQQKPGALRIYTLHAATNSQIPGVIDPVRFDLDYLKAIEDQTNDIDANGNIRGALLPYRLYFTNAASFKTTVTSRVYHRKIATSFQYLRDFEQSGSLWTLLSQYYVSRHVAVHAGVDILGSDDSSANNTDQHFLNQFRANDRVYGGLTYVF